MGAKTTHQKYKVEYVYPDGYSVLPASAIDLDLTPDDQGVICRFYFEHYKNTDTFELEPVPGEPDSYLDPDISDAHVIRRDIKAAFMLSPEKAVSIGEELAEYGRQLLKILSEKK